MSDSVIGFITRGYDLRDAPAGFEQLALDVFEYQFRSNEPYSLYCERRGITPDSIDSWLDIPAVPTAAFKETALYCGDPAEAAVAFRTSGTSSGSERRGTHYVRDLSLYRASALANFERHVLPDRVALRMLILGPSPDRAPDSSLSWMLELVRRERGAEGSAYYVGNGGLRLDGLYDVLELCERVGEPACLLGTAAAFAHLIEAMTKRGVSFNLPPGTRLMETGGFKVRGGEIPRDRFYEDLTRTLGVSAFYCIAEYGMTEMCSQFYDNVLRERTLARSPDRRYKVVPPWVRTQVVDAETLAPLGDGTPGLLRHFDLANLDSVSALQTEDVGIAVAGGFEIIGRASSAETRGCSIAIDEWLASQN